MLAVVGVRPPPPCPCPRSRSLILAAAVRARALQQVRARTHTCHSQPRTHLLACSVSATAEHTRLPAHTKKPHRGVSIALSRTAGAVLFPSCQFGAQRVGSDGVLCICMCLSSDLTPLKLNPHPLDPSSMPN